MKKILAMTLAVMMMVAVFAGCGGSGSTSSTAPAAPAASDTASQPAAPAETAAPANEVSLKWMVTGSTVTDDKAVMEKVNEYLKEKINVKLEMVWGTWGDFDDKATMAINGGDNIDIYFTSYWTRNEYLAYAKKGAYLRLDDLVDQYAPNFFNGMNPAMRDGLVIDGAEGPGLYALPAEKELAMQFVWEMNVPVLEKYGYTADDINDFYELGPIAEKIKAGEGADFYPLSFDTTSVSKMIEPSIFVDSTASLLTYQFDPVNPSKSGSEIKSRYETPEFKKYVEKMREYYLAGYINPAQALEPTMASTWIDAKQSGKWAISTRSAAPAYQYAESVQYGYQIDIKNAVAGEIDTNGPRGAMHAVSAISQNPDRAVQLLDLVNSDVYLHDLLIYGVEGVHYNLENGKVAFTEEKMKNYNVWKAGIGRLSLATPTVDDPDNIKQIIEEFNNVEAVPILGFTYDPEPVKNELAALANVRSEYFWSLAAGSVDPATELPKFIEKLKANGIDTVVADANRQLEEFLASK